MLHIFFVLLTTVNTSLAHGDSEWTLVDCASRPRLYDAVLIPTQSSTIAYRNDSRGGAYETTIVRQRFPRNISNRLAVDLPPNTDVGIDSTSQFEVISHNGHGLKMKTQNRNTFLFYCGDCQQSGRRPKLDDLLALKNPDGTAFFKVMCKKKKSRPKNPVVPASDTQAPSEAEQPIGI